MLDFLNRPASIRFRTPRAKPLRRHTTLHIDGAPHGVTIAENARATRFTLRLLPQPKNGDTLKVSCPPDTPRADIDAFLLRNVDWAREHLSAKPKAIALEHGATIPVRGRDTRIVHRDGRGATRIVETETDTGSELNVFGDPDHTARRVTDHLKALARADLKAAVARHAKHLGVEPTSITIRDTVSRWGSCSTTGALNFSWRIVLAPPDVLDYLAAHEVAHLREMNHSDRFWALVEDALPGMERQRRWLKENGATLHAVG